MPVAELPEAWNRGMQELLGVTPTNDAEGCLQDVHWSEGLFGYFPSYALGHLISAQLTESMEKEIGGGNQIDQLICEGEYEKIAQWLRDHVYTLGRSVNAEQLVERVTGRSLSCKPFTDYLEKKIEMLSSQ
jgi:carboxypeptidase Taq